MHRLPIGSADGYSGSGLSGVPLSLPVCLFGAGTTNTITSIGVHSPTTIPIIVTGIGGLLVGVLLGLYIL